MKLSMNELACTFLALNQDKDGAPRKFQFTDLAKVTEIAKKLDEFVVEGRIEDKDHELSLTADEKVFIKEKIEEMNWQMGDALHVTSLVDKLK